MCQPQLCLSNAIYMPHAQITQYALMGEVCHIYVTYEFTEITMGQEVLYTDNNTDANVDANANDDNMSQSH